MVIQANLGHSVTTLKSLQRSLTVRTLSIEVTESEPMSGQDIGQPDLGALREH